MDIFGLSMESDIVEELAIKMYDELEKIISDNDPMIFSSLIFLISKTLEQLNNRIVRENELLGQIQVMREENEELLTRFRNRGSLIEDKDRMILQYQSELEAYHYEKELLTNDCRLMKKKIIELNQRIKELQRMVESFESESYLKEEKLDKMEEELKKRVICHGNPNMKKNVCQYNFVSNNNNKENTSNAFVVLKRHVSDINENIFNELALSSNTESNTESDTTESNTNGSLHELSANIELEPIKTNLSPGMNISIFSDATGKEISLILKKHFPNTCNIISFVKSNATFLHVVESCRPECFTEIDNIVLIFGITDIDLRKECEIFMKLEPYLGLFNKTNVWVCTLPYRYDLSPDDPKQNIICLINNYIKEISIRLSHVKVIDIYGFKQNNFNRDGVYLNGKGRKKLSGLIHKSIKMS